MTLTLSEFARRCHGTLVGSDADIQRLVTDSREVQPGDLFIAIKGARSDGHLHVQASLQLGSVGSLVEKPVAQPYILVPNIVEALARFAASVRSEFAGPVVGITGSAGKTTAKEFVSSALSPLGRVLKSPGNRNTEYTSPLLWADFEPSVKAVVVEMAMRGFGQIAHLTSFNKPTMGLITNIGFAHLEQVGDRKGILRAKGELFENLPSEGVGIYWSEDDFNADLRSIGSCKKLTFGFGNHADSRVVSYLATSWHSCTVQGEFQGTSWCAKFPSVGKHMALNAAAAIAAAAAVGVSVQAAADALSRVALPQMRMEIVERDGVTIVLDTYNASPPSVIAALETIRDLGSPGTVTVILGEMKELGAFTEEAHRLVGRAVASFAPLSTVFYGEPMRYALDEAIRQGYPSSSIVEATSIEQLRAIVLDLKRGDTVLIKGSRSLELERILEP